MTNLITVTWGGVSYFGSTFEEVKQNIQEDPRSDVWDSLVKRASSMYKLRLDPDNPERCIRELASVGELKLDEQERFETADEAIEVAIRRWRETGEHHSVIQRWESNFKDKPVLHLQVVDEPTSRISGASGWLRLYSTEEEEV